MPVRVGIPRYLAYFSYYPWWKTFFEELGFEVITSSPTTKKTLDDGVAEAVNDACIPIKLYHGHVIELKDKVDIIFVPRLVKVRKFFTETFCPKFLALPDLLQASINDLPEILDTRIDLSQGPFELFRISREVGERFGVGLSRITRAYLLACNALRRYKKLMLGGMLADEALEHMEKGGGINRDKKRELTIAVLGYPYLIYDNFINLDLVKKLRKMGVDVVTAEMVSNRSLLREAKRMPKQMFWHYSNRAMHAAYYYMNRKRVDGLIHVTAFICGPDAMLDRLMEIESHQHDQMPFLTISIDEETGSGGVDTRLEAFIDMLKRRRVQG
ncbi:MAG: acyl-CoA dehydratase activase-related protein [Thermacetogeniaceae bacterium]|jgi:predicted nucleotide-binding protein (sugar kinase/HSP70/actin superfamily)|nr:acyl-CoA dehydratase activase-related protein [Thermoanaerobacterales bacterium]NLN20703.1 2-hydroxyglutaryl-CoA dehydratase [Syntrophomonadaceae bacterium]HAF17621.1 2-hydroxyglutaryl-CoA dehydratase [Peptococcaceae bacterium]